MLGRYGSFDPTYFGFTYFPIPSRCNRMGLTHSGGGFFYTTTINSFISVQIDGIPFSALPRKYTILRVTLMREVTIHFKNRSDTIVAKLAQFHLSNSLQQFKHTNFSSLGCLLQVDIFLKEVRQKQAWLGSPSGFSWLELAFMPFWQIVKGGCRILNV